MKVIEMLTPDEYHRSCKNYMALYEAITEQSLDATIVITLANPRSAPALQAALYYGINVILTEPENLEAKLANIYCTIGCIITEEVLGIEELQISPKFATLKMKSKMDALIIEDAIRYRNQKFSTNYFASRTKSVTSFKNLYSTGHQENLHSANVFTIEAVNSGISKWAKQVLEGNESHILILEPTHNIYDVTCAIAMLNMGNTLYYHAPGNDYRLDMLERLESLNYKFDTIYGSVNTVLSLIEEVKSLNSGNRGKSILSIITNMVCPNSRFNRIFNKPKLITYGYAEKPINSLHGLFKEIVNIYVLAEAAGIIALEKGNKYVPNVFGTLLAVPDRSHVASYGPNPLWISAPDLCFGTVNSNYLTSFHKFLTGKGNVLTEDVASFKGDKMYLHGNLNEVLYIDGEIKCTKADIVSILSSFKDIVSYHHVEREGKLILLFYPNTDKVTTQAHAYDIQVKLQKLTAKKLNLDLETVIVGMMPQPLRVKHSRKITREFNLHQN